MKGILILTLICLAVSESYAEDKLECYQCSPVTLECEVSKAEQIKCGLISTSKCAKQVKKGSSDDTKAIRKCVAPQANGQIACPDGYDCYNCNSDLCNAGSVLKVTWGSLFGVFLAVLYLY